MAKKDERIELGWKVKDTITGFTGVAVAFYDYLHGCRRIEIQPTELHEGKPIAAQSFDEPQLKVVSRKVHGNAPAVPATTGGPERYPPPVRG